MTIHSEGLQSHVYVAFMTSCLRVHLFSTAHRLHMEMSAKGDSKHSLNSDLANTFSCANNPYPPLSLSLSLSRPSFREIVGKKVVRALRRKDDGISHASVDFLCALMQPMHDNYDLRQEQMNKSSLLSSKPFLEMVLEPLKTHVVSKTTPLVYVELTAL